MSTANQDKVNGNVNGFVGKAKEIAGQVSNNPSLKSEGQDQQMKGDLQKAAGAAKSILQKGIHRAGDLIEKVGNKIEHAADKS